MKKNSKIYVAGHRGLTGSAIVRQLKKAGYRNIVCRTREELDLFDAKAVANFFKKEKPEFVFLAAAKVGGIFANLSYPADFIYQNLQIQNNVIHQAYLNNVTKLLFLGSSCIYPRDCPQPIKEEYLLDSPLEETNKYYSIAKIAGISLCQAYNKQYGVNFISCMPTNLYGQNDNFDLLTSHVIPSIIRKFHEAKRDKKEEVTCWGKGLTMREFLHVDDMADACIFLMNHYNESEIVNVGTGEDVIIKELIERVRKLVGFKGKIVWDTSKPDGTPRKLLNISRLRKLGWKHKISLDRGLKDTYEWFKKNEAQAITGRTRKTLTKKA